MNYQTLCSAVCEIAKQTGAYIKNESKSFSVDSIEYKGWNDLVSHVDKTSEQQLIKQLSILISDCSFIAEEQTVALADSKFKWIIDPLDGTTNFVHGLPCYCISIALLEDDELVLGVVYEINQDECFYAYKNGKAFLNEKEISVSKIPDIKQSLIATGFPYTKFERLSPYMDVFDYCMHNSHGLRRLGSAAVDLAYVACGRFEAFYEYGLRPWDVAAGAFIVQKAGGKVSDFKGGNNWLFGEELITTNNLIFDEFLSVVKEKFADH